MDHPCDDVTHWIGKLKVDKLQSRAYTAYNSQRKGQAMTHTFFEKNNYNKVQSRQEGPFIVSHEWQYESTQLELVFDPSEEYWDELVEKLDSGEWMHIVAKVAVYYDGRELGSAYLGSVVCEDPEEWFNTEADYVADLEEQALEEARNETVRMLDRLKADFLQ